MTLSMIAASELPYSQTSSVRFGAPIAGLPLPSGPWQAAQICANTPCRAAPRIVSCGNPDSERT